MSFGYENDWLVNMKENMMILLMYAMFLILMDRSVNLILDNVLPCGMKNLIG